VPGFSNSLLDLTSQIECLTRNWLPFVITWVYSRFLGGVRDAHLSRFFVFFLFVLSSFCVSCWINLLPVSLSCSFLIALRFSLTFILSCVLWTQCCLCLWVVYFFIVLRFSLTFILSCVLCTQYCQFLWVVHSWLPLRFSLTFILSCVLCTQCCQCLWIVHSSLLLRFSIIFIRNRSVWFH
jgi:hypothetical protein